MPLQHGDEQDLPGSTAGGIFGCGTVVLRDHPSFSALWSEHRLIESLEELVIPRVRCQLPGKKAAHGC